MKRVVNLQTGKESRKRLTEKDKAQQKIDAEKKKPTRYRDQRALAYPSVKDQLDMIYHKGFDAWKEVITEVKNKYPKPE